jgi:hypothetical protein
MAKNASISSTENPGMILVLSFAVLYIVNMIVIYFANMWFGLNVVLGTMSLSTLWALLLSAGTVAVINTFSIPFFHEWEMRRGKILSSWEWMAGYFVINVAAIWLVTRAAEIFGMGVSSWIVILVLAAVLDFVQGIGMMSLQSMQKQQ